MATPRVVALRASGTNCHRETVHAFNLAGARAEHVHINHLLKERDPLAVAARSQGKGMPNAGAGCDMVRRVDWLCRQGVAGKGAGVRVDGG